MTRKELKEKISEISNSEFPLIDFFNDIDWLDDKRFNTEKAYEDIEKIYNVFVYYKDKVKKTEKELKQTKLNFKNSQIHSKNCYKKLKEKYTRLERAYKNNEVMTRDLNELINRNLELKNELKRCQETISAWMDNHKKLIIDNDDGSNAIRLLQVIGMYEELEEELGIDLITLFKAKKVYFKYNEEDINIKKSYKVCFDITNSCLIAYEGIFDDFGTWLELKDYKKTWWLDKPKENDDE